MMMEVVKQYIMIIEIPRVLAELSPRVFGIFPDLKQCHNLRDATSAHIQAAVSQHLAALHHDELLQVLAAAHEPLGPQPGQEAGVTAGMAAGVADLTITESSMRETFTLTTTLRLPLDRARTADTACREQLTHRPHPVPAVTL